VADLYDDETVEQVAYLAMMAHYGDKSWREEAKEVLDTVAPLIAAKALRAAIEENAINIRDALGYRVRAVCVEDLLAITDEIERAAAE
jgi:kynureninase